MQIKSLPLSRKKDSLAYTNTMKLKILKNSFFKEYSLIPELITLKKIGGNVVLFSPLLLRLYFIKKEKYEKLMSGNLENDMQEFIDEYLLIPKNFDIFPEDNEFLLRISFTGDCNLRCIYCTFKGGESKKSIELEFAKAAIDYAINYIKHKPRKKLTFFFSGGEPTLKIEMVREICNYIKSRIKKNTYLFHITTNGMFSEKLDRWLLKNMDSIAISLDGPPEIQNITRPLNKGKASSHVVEKTTRRLAKYKKSSKVASVINKNSVYRQTEILNYLYGLGVDEIVFLQPKPFGRSLNKNLGYDNYTFIENFLKAIEIAEDYGILLRTNLLNMMSPVNTSCKLGNILNLTEEGKVITCPFLKDYLSSTKSSLKPYYIGYYDNKEKKLKLENEKNIEFLSERNIRNILGCRSCFAKWSCGGGCPIKGFREHKDFYKPSKDCEIVRNAMREYLMFKAEKHFLRIKPYIEKRSNELYFSMFFNEFKLNILKNGENLKAPSLVKIDSSCNFERLYKNIIREKKKRKFKTSLFLLSFDMDLKWYIENSPLLIKFLRKLKRNRIYFKVTKPLPRCLFGSEYSRTTEELNIPKSCFECLELFTVQDGKIKMCNGKEDNLKNFLSREEIYNKYKPAKNVNRECKFCKFYFRGKCNGICSHTIFSN